MAGKFKTRVKRVNRRRFKKRVTKPMAKSIRKIAKQEIAKATEDKMIRSTSNLLLGNNPDGAAGSGYLNNIIEPAAAIRSIAQGTGQGQRIGTRIKLTRFMFSGTLFPRDGESRNQVVKMWVVTDRLDPYNGFPTDIVAACQTSGVSPSQTFFENGNSTTGMNSNLIDLHLAVNKDRFKVHTTRTFKLSFANIPSAQGGNNDFSALINFKVNLLKYVPKRFIFQDASTIQQYNRKVFMIFAPYAANGSTGDGIQTPVHLIRNIDIKYEDM